jgi:hypothetical protein
LMKNAPAQSRAQLAGETACATMTSRVFAVVGQAVSPASPACGRFFTVPSASGPI